MGKRIDWHHITAQLKSVSSLDHQRRSNSPLGSIGCNRTETHEREGLGLICLTLEPLTSVLQISNLEKIGSTKKLCHWSFRKLVFSSELNFILIIKIVYWKLRSSSWFTKSYLYNTLMYLCKFCLQCKINFYFPIWCPLHIWLFFSIGLIC